MAYLVPILTSVILCVIGKLFIANVTYVGLGLIGGFGILIGYAVYDNLFNKKKQTQNKNESGSN